MPDPGGGDDRVWSVRGLTMGTWFAVLAPAVTLALVVRIDARFIGPYFSLAALVPGYEGVEATGWYERHTLRFAIVRRFTYPALAAAGLGFLGFPLSDVVAVAGVGAGLLLWPVVFHGLPRGVSRRDWEVPAMYCLFVVAFVGAAAAGFHVLEFMRFLGDGSASQFMLRSGGEAIFWLAVGSVATAFFRPSLASLRNKKRHREDRVSRMHHEGDPEESASGRFGDPAQ